MTESPLNLCPIYIKIRLVLASSPENMDKKFEVNQTKIRGQSGRKEVTHNSKSGLPLMGNIKLENFQVFLPGK